MAQERGTGSRGTGRRVGRPAPARRTPGRRPGDRPRSVAAPGTAAVRPRLTARAAVLVLVLAVLTVSYASSLRAYLQQRHQIQSLQDSIASSQEHITAMRREKERWGDDAYVIAQARARFAFGFPGEIGYQVLDENGKPLDHEDSLTDPTRSGDGKPEWWQTTLTSIDTAGHPPHVSTPAHRIPAPPPSTGQ